MKVIHVLLSIVTGFLCLGTVILGWSALHGPASGSPIFSYTVMKDTPLRFALTLTPLSGVFLCMLGVVGALASVYGIGYGNEYHARKYGVWLDAGLFGFIGAMDIVFTSANVLTFMTGWEAMSIVSYLLVVFDSHKPEVVKSGLLYAVMTQLGSVFLLAAFFLLHSYTKSYDFSAFARLAHTLPPSAQTLVFLSALIGFLTKAGIMPLHIWLPQAHPVAPSHVSALMSGVMIKTALFGFLLVSVDWLHGAQAWWGLLVTLLGGVSAVLGSLLAAQDGSLKRILAYSSIDNMGLIFLCAGVALMEMALHQPVLAGFALTASLYQAWNHALFKSALFQGAGAVLYATHTGTLNQLGGLIKRMPWTSASFLLSLLSFAALPPWGGFASEWMMFSSLARVASAHLHGWAGLASVSGMIALFLTGALSVFAALRIFGIGFLAEPRSEEAAHASEVPISMRLSLGLGAALTLVAGLSSPWMVDQIGHALPGRLSYSSWSLWYGSFTPLATESILLLGGVAVLGALLAWALSRLVSGRPRISTAPTWTCGGQRIPSMSYSATGFSQPIHRVWGWSKTPVAMQYLYRPAWMAVVRTTTAFRAIQSGHVRSYLIYLFATVLLLLLIAR